MLIFQSALATLMGSSNIVSVSEKKNELMSGPSQGAFKCAGGDNGVYFCVVDTREGANNVAEIKNEACAGWTSCSDVILGGTIDGIEYAALGKEEGFNPEARVGGDTCTIVKMGLVGCL